MRVAPYLAALLLSISCASGPGSVAEKLALANRDTQDALKFGDFEVIARYLPFERRTEFLSRAFGMEEKLAILELQPISNERSPDGDKAIVLTRMSWYELPSTVVQTDSVFFEWRRDEASSPDGSWTLVRIDGGPAALRTDATK